MRLYSEAVRADVRRRMSPPHRQSVARISSGYRVRIKSQCLTPHSPVAKKAPPANYTWGCPLLSSHDARVIANGRRLRLAAGGCVMSFN